MLARVTFYKIRVEMGDFQFISLEDKSDQKHYKLAKIFQWKMLAYLDNTEKTNYFNSNLIFLFFIVCS